MLSSVSLQQRAMPTGRSRNVAEDSDDETKEDGSSEHSTKMFITEGKAIMQRRWEQKHASTIWRIAMQSNQGLDIVRSMYNFVIYIYI